jgi:hypothetical protein
VGEQAGADLPFRTGGFVVKVGSVNASSGVEIAHFKAFKAPLTAQEVAYEYNAGAGKRYADLVADIAAATPTPGAVVGAVSPTVLEGDGVAVTAPRAGRRRSLAIAPPTRTAMAAGVTGIVSNLSQTGTTKAWLGLTTTNIDAGIDRAGTVTTLRRSVIGQRTGANPLPSGHRDLLGGTPQEQRRLAFHPFAGHAVTHKVQDGSVLLVAYCAMKSFDGLGDGVTPGTENNTQLQNEANWDNARVAILTATVFNLSVEPTWSIAYTGPTSNQTRDVSAAPNAIGQQWAICHDEHAIRGHHLFGVSNYLQRVPDEEKPGVLGVNEIYGFYARANDEGDWSISVKERIAVHDANVATAALGLRHFHNAALVWTSDTELSAAVAFQAGDGSSVDGGIARALLSMSMKQAAPAHFANLADNGQLLTGGSAFYEWDNPTANPYDRVNDGWNQTNRLHGSVDTADARPGRQDVGAVRAGSVVLFGVDEAVGTIAYADRSALASDAQDALRVYDIPGDRQSCFYIAATPSGVPIAVAENTRKGSFADYDTQAFFTMRNGVWGVLAGTGSNTVVNTVTDAEAVILDAGGNPFLLDVQAPWVVVPGMMAEPGGTNVLEGGTATNVAAGVTVTDVTASYLDLTGGVAHGHGTARVFRVQYAAGWGGGSVASFRFDQVAAPGRSMVAVSVFNLDKDAQHHGMDNLRVVNDDGTVGAVAWGNRHDCRADFVVVNGAWAERRSLASGVDAGNLGGNAGQPTFQARVSTVADDDYSPADVLLVFAVVPVAATDMPPATIPNPGATLASAAVSVTLPASATGTFAVALGLELGPCMQDRFAPTGNVVDLATIGNGVKSYALSMNLDTGAVTVTDEAAGTTAVAAADLGGVTPRPGDILHAMMTGGISQHLWLSWNNKPWHKAVTNGGAQWKPTTITMAATGNTLLYAAMQPDRMVSDASGAYAAAYGIMRGLPTGAAGMRASGSRRRRRGF